MLHSLGRNYRLRRSGSAFLVAGVLVVSVITPLVTGAISASAASPLSAFNKAATTAALTASKTQVPNPPKTGPKAAKGKSFTVIPCSSTDLACQEESVQFQAVAKTLGWKSTLINPAGDATQMSAAVSTAITSHSSGIFTVAIDAATIPSSLTQAKAAGISSGCFACVSTKSLYSFTLPTNQGYVNDGYNLAAEAYIQNKNHLRAIMIGDAEFAVANLRQDGIQNFISACQVAGGDCSILASPQILVANLATTVPAEIVSVCAANPTWNALFTTYDGSFVFIIPAVVAAGVKPGQHAYGFDPVSVNIGWIKTGHLESATVAGPYTTIAYASVDEFNRIFNHKPVVNEHVVDKLLIASNLPKGTNYNGDDINLVKAAYHKIWGK